MATINGYCQVTACTHMAEPMPICNDENAVMPYKTPKVNWKADGMVPVEWIKEKQNKYCLNYEFTKAISQLLEMWEKENE